MVLFPKKLIKSIEVCHVSGFYKMGNSMCYDSGISVLSAKVETTTGKTYEVYIETQGSVRVFWHGNLYKCASQMPDELLDMFEFGSFDFDDDCDCVETNWWEISVYRDGKYLDYCSGVMSCDPDDFSDDNDLKDYIIEVISNDF